MINNKSDKPEKFIPQDSEQKNIRHPQDDEEAVLKPKDKKYKSKNADFKNPAETKEQSEQPVTPIKKAPKDV